jgi:hypothetical protein
MRNTPPPLVALALAGLVTSGCFRAQARTAPDAPPLDVPPPPPRVVEAIEPNAPEPIGLTEEPARTAPARPRTTQTPPRAEPPKPEPAKVEPVPVETPKPEEPPRAQPAATLQMTPTQREAELEREIRLLVSRANADLARVDYGRLNADAKAQYELAKTFIRQAEEAVKSRNLVFARTNADKAATLAAQLSGR